MRESDRLAAAAQAPAQRAPEVDLAPLAAALVAARSLRRRRELEPRHEPVELRELSRLERVEAAAREPLLVAGHGTRDLGLAARVLAVVNPRDDRLLARCVLA